MASYLVIYDGRCNLCANLVQVLERLDQAQQFQYLPMQSPDIQHWGITPESCEQGMILLSLQDPSQRWQGSDAAEEIGRLLPLGSGLIRTYRSVPGVKGLGDRLYAWIRDNRYLIFGQRSQLYTSTLAPICQGQCSGMAFNPTPNSDQQ